MIWLGRLQEYVGDSGDDLVMLASAKSDAVDFDSLESLEEEVGTAIESVKLQVQSYLEETPYNAFGLHTLNAMAASLLDKQFGTLTLPEEWMNQPSAPL